jgi:hypothetical protein
MTVTVAIVNQKGGTGKTTLATNVARGLQLEGSRVLLVDSDPQGTARDWRQASEIDNMLSVVGVDRPLSLERDLPDIAQAFDWIVIDGAANLKNQALTVNAVKVADVVLIPVQGLGECGVDLLLAVDHILIEAVIPFIEKILDPAFEGTSLRLGEGLRRFQLTLYEEQLFRRLIVKDRINSIVLVVINDRFSSCFQIGPHKFVDHERGKSSRNILHGNLVRGMTSTDQRRKTRNVILAKSCLEERKLVRGHESSSFRMTRRIHSSW